MTISLIPGDLTKTELILYSQVLHAIRSSGEPDTREAGLRHLRRIAEAMIANPEIRERAISNVTAFADSLVTITQQGGEA
jgi:hypothetical protein